MRVKNLISKDCGFCKINFTFSLSQARINRRFCTKKCALAFLAVNRKEYYEKICNQCGKKKQCFKSELKRSPRVFCSSDCQYKWMAENLKGEAHHSWKGENAGYSAMHLWLNKEYGKPKECYFCARKEKLEWANISKQYLRDINDFIPLCKLCHRKFDSLYFRRNIKAEKTKLVNKDISIR